MAVVVLHLMGHLMEWQLDPAAGQLLQHDLESRGIVVHRRAQTKAILGHERRSRGASMTELSIPPTSSSWR